VLRRCGKHFKNFHLTTFKILAFEVTKILFGALQKIKQMHFIRSHLYEKMSKVVVILWIPSSKQFGYKLENFKIIWNCVTNRKKIISRKK